MHDFTLFLIAFLIYISALFFYFYYFFARREVLARVGFWIVAVGVIFHTLALIVRTVSTGHAPFANMYESISFFAWTIVVAYLIMETRY
ncbi:MAG: c-type cytochrome biogenesis protein CcsB, partial [Candidatus Aminicenantes bacterium]|nr:c-type cytochrome biogenesis protein CcsB [Candidatus Aminicenantes bacterium]